jgi:hypothetical protein
MNSNAAGLPLVERLKPEFLLNQGMTAQFFVNGISNFDHPVDC